MSMYVTQTNTLDSVEKELIPQFKSMVITLRIPKKFNKDEWAYAHNLIWSNNVFELSQKFGNYIFDESALSLAIYAKADKIILWLLENGVKSTYQHVKEAAIQGLFHLFDKLIESGADLHYNNDEILFYISNYYDKLYHPRTQKELPYLIKKYNLQKTSTNCGF